MSTTDSILTLVDEIELRCQRLKGEVAHLLMVHANAETPRVATHDGSTGSAAMCGDDPPSRACQRFLP